MGSNVNNISAANIKARKNSYIAKTAKSSGNKTSGNSTKKGPGPVRETNPSNKVVGKPQSPQKSGQNKAKKRYYQDNRTAKVSNPQNMPIMPDKKPTNTNQQFYKGTIKNNQRLDNAKKPIPQAITEEIPSEVKEEKKLSGAKQNKEKSLKRKNKSLWLTLIGLMISIGLMIGIYFVFRPKFKDLTIELGTNTVRVSDFLIKKSDAKDAKVKTDLSQIDFTQVAEYEIELTYKGKAKKVKLKIVDTTAPVVVFKNVIAYEDYQIDANDFIEEKEDLSEMKVYASEVGNLNEFKDYEIEITVEDEYGNKTSEMRILTITWLRDLVYIELGNPFSKADVIVNMEKDADKISDEEISKVDPSKVGEYQLKATYEGKEYQTKVIIQDTTPPELQLKDVTIYLGETIKGKETFIKSVKDASGVITTSMQTKIDYKKIGKQEIVIEAIDGFNNKITKKAILTIKKDAEGPVFSGLTNLTVKKYASNIDYLKGVKAVDAKDGTRDFDFDASKVNPSVAGTYYATYTAVDNTGNKTTKKRKVTVLHNAEDTEAKFNEFYKKYLAGKSVLEMVRVIKTKIKYTTNGGGGDPIWYGLTNLAGDCYVHAMLTKKALDKAGITNRLIYVKDKTHYWNLVQISGVWRHYDSTPGSHIIGPATDTQKFNSSQMRGRDWDRSAFPKAE